MHDHAEGGVIWELRVHGVSDTPPESVLQSRGEGPEFPPVKLVAGDSTVGFYQYRVTPAGADPRFQVEAFSWGQLTSGRRLIDGSPGRDLRRAAWSLLLPFALLNVALWARPQLSARPGDGGAARWLAGLVRLMALTLTGTIVLTAAGFGMDELAWQCRGRCDRNVYGFGFLASDRLLGNGWLPVIGSLLPLGLLLGIVLVVSSTFRYEAVLPVEEAVDAEAGREPRHPMEDRHFWHGQELVRALRPAHVAVGVAAVGHLLATSAWAWQPRDGAARWTPVGAGARTGGHVVSLVALLAVLLAAAAVLRAGAGSTRPDDVPHDPPDDAPATARSAARDTDRIGRLGRYGLAAAVVSLLAGAVVAGFGNGPGVAGSPNALPGYEATIRGLFLVQFGLLLVCLVVNRLSAVGSGRLGDTPDAPAWKGLATSVFTGGALVSGLTLSAAILLGGAWWFNTSDGGSQTATASATLQWAAFGFAFGAVAAVLLAVTFALRWQALQRTEYQAVLGELPDPSSPHQREAARHAASWRAIHVFDGYESFTRVGGLAIVALGILSAGAVVGVINVARTRFALGAWSDWFASPHGPAGDPSRGTGYTSVPAGGLSASGVVRAVLSAVSDVGGWIAVGALLGFVLLIGGLYRRRTVRRTFGVVWDIVTFWPRAAHPFGPPCYAERAVPELATRIQGRAGHRLVLAGHSQGGLLAAACVFMLNAERRRSIYLLTYGTQITRFYGRAFPAFFGPREREHLADRLTTDGVRRWRSLWRATDPLGWPIGGGAGKYVEQQTDSVLDIYVPDPDGYVPEPPGEVLDPPIRQHSDYPKSQRYIDARDRAFP